MNKIYEKLKNLSAANDWQTYLSWPDSNCQNKKIVQTDERSSCK